jgi:uncharacterized protein (TIGR02246 family)
MTLTPEDKTAIRKVLDDYMELWMEGKAAACTDLYDGAGDLLAVDGTFLRSPDEIRRYYEQVMSGKYAGFKFRSIQTLGIRLLGEGLALLDATWEVCAPSEDGSSGEVVAKPIGSLVVAKVGDRWKISAARLMVPIQLSE